jgi:acyl dehydratase
MMRYFEDFEPGSREGYGHVVIEAAEMDAFAREFDPQPMHLDAASAQAALMGGLIASGWYTCSRNMRMMAEHFILKSSGMGSPGVSSLKWLAPVRAGDRLSGTMEVLGRRASTTKPDRGFVDFRFTLANQAGQSVLEQVNLIMFARRDPGAPDPLSSGSAVPPPPVETFTADPTPGSDHPGFIEDIAPGTVIRFGSYDFTPEAMLRFARAYDPQEFHLSEAAGRASHFGGLSASGWHTASAWMGTVIRFWQRIEAEGHRLPARGPGFGFTDLIWKRPVLAGDRLTYFARVLDARRSASRPGWGILSQRNYALNQRGEAVFAFTGAVMWQARP